MATSLFDKVPPETLLEEALRTAAFSASNDKSMAPKTAAVAVVEAYAAAVERLEALSAAAVARAHPAAA